MIGYIVLVAMRLMIHTLNKLSSQTRLGRFHCRDLYSLTQHLISLLSIEGSSMKPHGEHGD